MPLRAAGKGSISGADFANSLVTAADVRRVDALLDKVGDRAGSSVFVAFVITSRF